jgi:site-specific recombinase XerD
MSKRKYTLGHPHLTRRRGRNKFWNAWIDGKELSLGTPDRIEAQRRLDIRAEQCERAPGSASPAAPTHLSALGLKFAEYCQPPRHTPNTAASYTNRFTMFVEWAEHRRVVTTAQITYAIMMQYVRTRSHEGAGPATINRDVIAVRLAFAFALREGLIADDPFDSRTFRALKLKEPRGKPNMLTMSPAQIDTFLDVADTMAPPVYAALFRLAAGSGVRIDEARHVDLGDVDDARKILTITPKPGWTTKGYRYRNIPISERTAKAVRSFVATRAGVTLDDKSVWRELHRVRVAAEVPRFTMHDLRRAWASAMHANGASLKQVSVWLGHADIATTERYIRIFETQTEGHEYLPR